MKLNQQVVIDQIDKTLQQCKLRSLKGYDDLSDLPNEVLSKAVTLLLASIRRLSPPVSTYVNNAQAYEHLLKVSIGSAIPPLTGILSALRSDYEEGHLQSIQELIHADIFADFLEMAAYLLEQKFKDPAAVIAGSVLEEHLRKLAVKNGITLSLPSGSAKKADFLNSELAGAGAYNKLDQKGVTGWLDLRNKAAHGHYNEYSQEQVSLMLQSVQDFMSRNSARRKIQL